MARMIDAEWLKELYKPYENFNGKMYSVPVGAILANIEDAPSIDIVKCGECKWFDTDNTGETYCMSAKGLCDVNADDFCSYGEREGE